MLFVAGVGCAGPSADGDHSDPEPEPACEPDEALNEPMACGTEVPACGGDPTGSWTVTDWCSDFTGDLASGTTTYTSYYCDGFTVRRQVVWDSTLTFSADQVFLYELEIDGHFELDLPQECVEYLGYADCAELMEYVVYGLECSDRAEGGCSCVAEIDVTAFGEGTWSTCRGVLTVSEFPATATGTYVGYPYTTTTTEFGGWETAYCIDGDFLRLQDDPDELAGIYERI